MPATVILEGDISTQGPTQPSTRPTEREDDIVIPPPPKRNSRKRHSMQIQLDEDVLSHANGATSHGKR